MKNRRVYRIPKVGEYYRVKEEEGSLLCQRVADAPSGEIRVIDQAGDFAVTQFSRFAHPFAICDADGSPLEAPQPRLDSFAISGSRDSYAAHPCAMSLEGLAETYAAIGEYLKAVDEWEAGND
jgi:hypothetical protein